MDSIPRKKQDSCIIEGCKLSGDLDSKTGNRYFTKGYCTTHYKRLRRGGDMHSSLKQRRPAIVEGDIAKIPLGINAKDGYAIVDKEFAWLDKYHWHKSDSGYAIATVGGRFERMHHLVIGKPAEGMHTDHINRVGIDNRSANLRIGTPSQNGVNKPPIGGSSKYKGVHARKFVKGTVYVAMTSIKNKSVHIGSFDTESEAAQAYNDYVYKMHGEFAYLNVID